MRKKKKPTRWLICQQNQYLIHITGLFDFPCFGAIEDAHRFRYRKNAMHFIKLHSLKKCKPQKI